MVVFYYKDAHGKASFSSAHQRCTGSTAQTCLSSYSCFIMAYPDDKSMTKIDGNAHVPVISKNYTCATDSRISRLSQIVRFLSILRLFLWMMWVMYRERR